MHDPLGQAEQRRNNFNFLRLLAAVTVVFSHSFNVIGTRGVTAPGMQLGDIAVDFFFVTSGFLVTASALSRRDPAFFLKSRALRIFPGLIISVGFAVFVMGPLVTVLRPGDYFADPRTYNFLLSNASLLNTGLYWLPGVFEGNAMGAYVNHPLWTLGWEISMYSALFLLALPYLCSERYRTSGMEALKFVFPLIFAAATALLMAKFFRDNADNAGPLMVLDNQTRLPAMFFGGASLWLWRERLSFLRKHVPAALLVLALILAAAISPRLFIPLYYLTVPWLVLAIAHWDQPWMRRINGRGDYSFGIYIYAFPVQQAVAMFWADAGAFGLFGLSMLIIVPLAVLSWHLVEKPALALRLRRRPAPPALAAAIPAN